MDLEGQRHVVAAEPVNMPEGEASSLLSQEGRPHVMSWRSFRAAAAVSMVVGAFLAVACAAEIRRQGGIIAFLHSLADFQPQQKQLLVMPVAAGADFDAWDRILQSHVSPAQRDGINTHQVDYAGVAADPDFELFIQSLETVDVASLTKKAFLATFMNAYNAFAIKTIIDNACQQGPTGQCSPLSSIGDVFKAAGGPWTRPIGKIGNGLYSLQQIEDALRKPSQFPEDPRVHACITCASISCPNLPLEAFRTESVEGQMAARMQALLSNPQKGLALDQTYRTVKLSKVFDWYKADFVQAAGSLIDFVLPYVSEQDQAFLSTNKASITVSHFPWDRSLNGDAPCNCAANRAATPRFA